MACGSVSVDRRVWRTGVKLKLFYGAVSLCVSLCCMC